MSSSEPNPKAEPASPVRDSIASKVASGPNSTTRRSRALTTLAPTAPKSHPKPINKSINHQQAVVPGVVVQQREVQRAVPPLVESLELEVKLGPPHRIRKFRNTPMVEETLEHAELPSQAAGVDRRVARLIGPPHRVLPSREQNGSLARLIEAGQEGRAPREERGSLAAPSCTLVPNLRPPRRGKARWKEEPPLGDAERKPG